jgi:hypothetical protein
MTREEYKQKLIDHFPGLDKREPITFAHGDDVLRMLMQAYDIAWTQGSKDESEKRFGDLMDVFGVF